MVRTIGFLCGLVVACGTGPRPRPVQPVTLSRVPDAADERLVVQRAADALDTHADDEERRWGIHEAAERRSRAQSNRVPATISSAALMMELEEQREAAAKPAPIPRSAIPTSRSHAIPVRIPLP
jgi:hypothetical protein